MTRSSSSSTRRCTARCVAMSRTPTTSCRSVGRPSPIPGSQVTVIAYGLMAHYALEAADRVAEDGISVEVIDLRTLRPAGQGDGPRFGPQDRQVPGRVRGQQVRRLRRRGRGDRGRGGLRLPRRPGDPDRRDRRSRACPTTTSSRTGSWSARRRSPTGSGRSRPTEAADADVSDRPWSGRRPPRGSSVDPPRTAAA